MIIQFSGDLDSSFGSSLFGCFAALKTLLRQRYDARLSLSVFSVWNSYMHIKVDKYQVKQ